MDEIILVSACLAGMRCRYDGNETPNSGLARLVEEGKALPLCPEMLGGLPTPRVPCEILPQGEDERRVIRDRDGEDRTESFEKGARVTWEICRSLGIKKAVLKSSSPSCGSRRVYDGTFSGNKIPGKGVTAELLIKNGISVVNEEEWTG